MRFLIDWIMNGAMQCIARHGVEHQMLNMGSDGKNHTMPRLLIKAAKLGVATGIILVSVPAFGTDDLDQPVPMWSTNYPDATLLLKQVVRSIPETKMQIRATITAKTRTGQVGRRVYAEVLMHTDAGLYSAAYTLRDALGGSLEQLTVSREPEQTPLYHYRRGDPLQDTRLPDLTSKIKETDLTWIDLCLAYLWWPDGEVIGTDKIRGRFCYVIELPAPQEHDEDFHTVRMWVDPKINMLLRAEAYDLVGDRVRRMSVESFKKVDGVWFIKDIEVYSYPGKTKTTLRVQSLDTTPQEEPDEPVTAATIE